MDDAPYGGDNRSAGTQKRRVCQLRRKGVQLVGRDTTFADQDTAAERQQRAEETLNCVDVEPAYHRWFAFLHTVVNAPTKAVCRSA